MLFKLILFSLLFFLTTSVIRMLRSVTRRQGGPRNAHPRRENRPAASPDEIVDVDFEDCESSKNDAKGKP